MGATEGTTMRSRGKQAVKATPAPADHEAERKRLLQKLERACIRRALHAVAPKRDEEGELYDWDCDTAEAMRVLHVAHTARLLLEGKELPVHLLPKEREE